MGSDTGLEDLQIFLQYVKSALKLVLADCTSLDNAKETIEELVAEIDIHVKEDSVTENAQNNSDVKTSKVTDHGGLYQDDMENSNDTTEYTDYFSTVSLTCDPSDQEETCLTGHVNREENQSNAIKNETGDFNDEANMQDITDRDDYDELTCKVCKQIFDCKEALQEHCTVHESDSRPLKCLICNLDFQSKQSLLFHLVKSNHVLSVDASAGDIALGLDDDDLQDFRAKLYTCAECGKQFTQPSLLKVHQLIHSNDDDMGTCCNICNDEFENTVGLKVHLVRVHGADIEMPGDSDLLREMFLTCEFCGRVFDRATALLIHRRRHMKNNEFNCSVCKKSGGKEELQKLTTTSKSKRKNPRKSSYQCWNCEICGESFTKRVRYYEHFNSHKDEDGFKCPECDRHFMRKENLKWHMATAKHTNFALEETAAGKDIISCDFCDKTFNKPSAHRLHLRTHFGDAPYQCEGCGHGFTNEIDLFEHMKTHSPDEKNSNKPDRRGSGLYKCQKCGKRYSTPVSLKAHIARHDGMKFKCNDCGKLFMRKESLQMHEIREGHHSGKDMTEFSKKLLPCNICGKKLLRPSLLVKHMRSHTVKAPSNFCAKCLEVFETEEEQQEHVCPIKQSSGTKPEGNSGIVQDKTLQEEITKILQEHNAAALLHTGGAQSLEEIYKSMSVDDLERLLKGNGTEDIDAPADNPVSVENKDETPSSVSVASRENKSAKRMKAYFIHKALRLKSEKGKFRKDGKTFYKCSYCPKYFARRGVTQNHERKHTGSKPFKCPTCGRAFSATQTLKNHLLTHAKEKPHQCSICNKGFVQKPSLRRHMFMHTGQVMPHKCNVCQKGFYREGELKKHMEKHDDTRPKVSHICEQCGKSFCTKQGLKNHCMLHEPIKKYYTCPVCHRDFTLAVRLKKHMTVHSDEKPFICNYCGKRFARSHYLTNHIRVHTGEKRFKCTYCFKGFTTSGQLAIHTRSHTGEKPYACAICGKRSTDSANHIKHMRTHQDKSMVNTPNPNTIKHRATSHTTSNNSHLNPPATHTSTMNNSNPHIHSNQNIERQLTPLHPDNLINMKHMRPLENENMLQPIHNPLQLPVAHNQVPPEAHGQGRLTRPPNFFNPMPTGHLTMPNSGYSDGSQFVFRYNDRM